MLTPISNPYPLNPILPEKAGDRPSVVITGIGLLTGLNTVSLALRSEAMREETWRRLRSGESALDWLDDPGVGSEARHAGARVPNRSGGDFDPLLGLVHSVADEAKQDAGLGHLDYDRDRTASVIGLSKGGLRSLAFLHEWVRSGRPQDPGDDRHWLPSWPSAGAAEVSRRFGLRGPCLAPVAACATGLVAALRGFELIRSGICDVAFCGAADASLEPLVLAAFRNMRALAPVGDDPRRAIRPWDRSRSGFLVGEGAAILVLERADHAKARGASPYAELAGGALGSDAHHITDQNPDPTGLADLIGRALAHADVAPTEIDHINVHGTATSSNDPLECRAIRRAFGTHADSISCSANKAQIGHLLGAAGAVELAITCLSIRDGFVPPTLNLTDPDPACNLDATPLVGRERPVRAALKLSIGFGGHLAAAILRRPDGPRRIAVGRAE